ncbi:DUF4229 domain-containing protein [Microbacterium sp. YY-01]|uniref:DUF4229 domain-containing protein n=1 Tax=Microbacterium sp. YY-01 TaxID=3421634 RepID=UPI003D168F8D
MKLPPLLVYSVLRLLAFLVPLGILWFFFPIFREYWMLAVLFSALIGVSLSLLFLRAPLSETSRDIYERRAAARTDSTDENVEDSDLDAAAHQDSRPEGDEHPDSEQQ